MNGKTIYVVKKKKNEKLEMENAEGRNQNRDKCGTRNRKNKR